MFYTWYHKLYKPLTLAISCCGNFHTRREDFFMNLNLVIIPSSKMFPLIVMNHEVSVVIVIAKTFKLSRSQYKPQSFRPRAFVAEKYDERRLQNKERINVLFVMT